jgi:hypothetical protein
MFAVLGMCISTYIRVFGLLQAEKPETAWQTTSGAILDSATAIILVTKIQELGLGMYVDLHFSIFQ